MIKKDRMEVTMMTDEENKIKEETPLMIILAFLRKKMKRSIPSSSIE